MEASYYFLLANFLRDYSLIKKLTSKHVFVVTRGKHQRPLQLNSVFINPFPCGLDSQLKLFVSVRFIP